VLIGSPFFAEGGRLAQLDGALARYAYTYESEGVERLAMIGDRLAIYLYTPPLAAVRGNTVVGGGGGTPLVEAVLRGMAQVVDNRVRLTGTTKVPVVFVQSVRAIATSNSVEAPVGRSGVAIDLDVDPSEVTVTGNITDGVIEVQGALLLPPWQPLNVMN
jgi:hypothetical protein